MIVGGGPAGAGFRAGGSMGSMGYGGGAYGSGAYGSGAYGGGGYGSGYGAGSGQGVGGGPMVVSGGGDCCGGGSGTVLAQGRHSGVMSGIGAGTGTGTGTVLQPNPGCGVGSGTSDTGCCLGGPEASCGGIGSACFEGAGTMVSTTDWTYVGEGRGTHTGGGYNYVGEGAGSYIKDTISTPYGCRLRPCCLILIPLLLLSFLLPYLLSYFNTTP